MTSITFQMISAEAPIIFAKACEIFILELTLRSWLHTEDSKRRTLQRSDVSAAIQKTDTFDFLIDIVPREDSRSMAKKLEVCASLMLICFCVERLQRLSARRSIVLSSVSIDHATTAPNAKYICKQRSLHARSIGSIWRIYR